MNIILCVDLSVDILRESNDNFYSDTGPMSHGTVSSFDSISQFPLRRLISFSRDIDNSYSTVLPPKYVKSTFGKYVCELGRFGGANGI